MNRICGTLLTVLLAGAAYAPSVVAQSSALDDLSGMSGAAAERFSDPQAVPADPQPEKVMQFLPPRNSEPGFDWPAGKSAGSEEFILIGAATTFFKVNDSQSEDLPDGTGKCALSANTRFVTAGKPGFEGEYVKAELKDPLPGCSFAKGYVFMPQVSCTSAGGACELPAQIRAFIDTLAYSEGVNERYNYIFTFATFKSYADHPRQQKCIGRLCSDAAGRYQFLSDTWDALAGDLGLKDFTPPSQDKAVMELIRRGGAYQAVSGSAKYANFTKAVYKLNGIWASLPGSPYGQPTHSMATLWSYYKTAYAKYK